MDAIRYLDADTILDYLHNSSETYLEGLIPQSYGFPTETDRSVYVRLLKVPVRDKASEVYIPSSRLRIGGGFFVYRQIPVSGNFSLNVA